VSSWAVVAVALLSAACTTAPVHAPQTPAPAPDVGEQQGTPGWEITHPGPEHAIEGFADHTSVLPGAAVRLFVSTTAAHYTVTAFRMGAYRGSDALRVWTSPPSAGSVQAPPVVQAPTRTVVAPWRPSLEVPTQGWQPGDYLLRLDGDNGAQQFVPLTVRSPSNAGKIVLVNAVTTWQAYNQWGGYSLYSSPGGTKAERSRAVSFDRPYQAKDMQGAGDFRYFELPLVRFAEAAGLPLGYATDVDLHGDAHLLDRARAVVTLGHDEYWSMPGPTRRPPCRPTTPRLRDRGATFGVRPTPEVARCRAEDRPRDGRRGVLVAVGSCHTGGRGVRHDRSKGIDQEIRRQGGRRRPHLHGETRHGHRVPGTERSG
jgi:hypothetical protein